MAVSTIAGIEDGGVKLTCILYEGVATVTSNVTGPDGYTDKGITFASGLYKDQWVCLDVQSDNTYAATQGLPVVKAMANGSLLVGKIITEPQIVVAPSTTPTATWAAHLTGKYYRVATVWFPIVTGVAKAVLVGASTANVVPGVEGNLELDASASNALAAAGSPDTLSVFDVANSGLAAFSFHYVASGSATVSILIGFTGGAVLIGT